MNKKRILNTIFFAIAVYALYLRAPTILNHFKHQDQKALDFTLKTLAGENFTLAQHPRKIVLVFWATWCGPCEVELKRLNKMIIAKEILPTDVLAIVSLEEENIIAMTVKKENYLFNVGIDTNGSVAKQYEVSATPTIVFVDENQTIKWMTGGISPALTYRVSTFLK